MSCCEQTESYLYENNIHSMLKFVWGIVNEKKIKTEGKTEKLEKKSNELRSDNNEFNQNMIDIDKKDNS